MAPDFSSCHHHSFDACKNTYLHTYNLDVDAKYSQDDPFLAFSLFEIDARRLIGFFPKDLYWSFPAL